MTLRRLLIIEFAVSLVLGTAACLGVSAYVAGTAGATGVAFEPPGSSNPNRGILCYWGRGFVVARTVSATADRELRQYGYDVIDPRTAPESVRRVVKRTAEVGDDALTGSFGWPLIFCRWRSTSLVNDEPLEGAYSWGPKRRFDIELPAAVRARGAGWGGANGLNVTISQLPSYLLPKPGHVDWGALAMCVGVFVVGCWIVLHLLVELVQALIRWGRQTI